MGTCCCVIFAAKVSGGFLLVNFWGWFSYTFFRFEHFLISAFLVMEGCIFVVSLLGKIASFTVVVKATNDVVRPAV